MILFIKFWYLCCYSEGLTWRNLTLEFKDCRLVSVFVMNMFRLEVRFWKQAGSRVYLSCPLQYSTVWFSCYCYPLLNYQAGKLCFLLHSPPRPNVVHIPLAWGNVVPHYGSHEEDYISFPRQLIVKSIWIRSEQQNRCVTC